LPEILVVEDDAAVRDVVEHSLSREGMGTRTAASGEAALEALKEGGFDLVVLDVMLPGVDGIEVCRELRAGAAGEANRDVPVLMLTARDDETSVVVGLEVGADDYVTKPFSPRELVSRVRAHLRRQRLDARRASEGDARRLLFPGLEMDLLRRRVVAGGEQVFLTAKEFDVLALLASSPGRVYSREQIMRHLWDGDFFGEARAADVHVQHIRKKIEPDPKDPRFVQTVRGAGYRFAEL
jgi:DNA-binding response OmpR family regulator